MSVSREPSASLDPNAGTARLLVVIPVALLSFFYMNMLEYGLPLYFEARSEAARLTGGNFPRDV